LHTGDKKYLEHARKVVNTNIALQNQNDGGFHPKQEFACGIIAESMAKYYLASGDEDVAKAVVRWAEWQIKGGLKSHWGSNGSMAQGFAYMQTGDEKFLKAASEVVHNGNTDNIGKDIAESWRNYPYTSGLLLMKK
jgi:rhamnogalacturonyl hydrolase YesR